MELDLLPTPLLLKREIPTEERHSAFVSRSRETIQDILEGRDPRILLVIGPCSVHDQHSIVEYARRLKELSSELDSVFVVLRTYFEKPRTLHGWKGLLYDPHLDSSHDIAQGLRLTRHILTQMAEIEIPCATEFLDPLTHIYFNELISWGCVGARTASSQPHRQMASGLEMPVGFKNSTSGCIDTAINAVISARAPHSFVGVCPVSGKLATVQTQGNPLAHVILRGSQAATNFAPEDVNWVIDRMCDRLVDPCVLVDCSHDNSRKDFRQQGDVFRTVTHQLCHGRSEVKGLMLESHLRAGKQQLGASPEGLHYGVSITDACMGWEETEDLVLWADDLLREARKQTCEVAGQ